MWSQTSSYALRTLGYLATHRDRWVLGKEIAEQTGIPANYLSKVLSQLRKKGMVRSLKGWGGGFQLREDALSSPILGVLELFDGARDAEACLFGLPRCDAANPCPLHSHWERIRGEIDSMLTTVTVGQLRKGPA